MVPRSTWPCHGRTKSTRPSRVFGSSSPSRCGLLTGRQPQRAGVERVLFPRDDWGLPDDERTMADELHGLGYRTFMAGKWHLGCRERHFPTRHGFEEFYGLLYSNDMNPLHLYRNEEIAEDLIDGLPAALRGLYRT